MRRVGGSSVYTVAGSYLSTSRRIWAAEQRLVTTAGYLVMPRMQKVELRGLEPLTFLLLRHGVDLIRREHGVIGVQVA